MKTPFSFVARRHLAFSDKAQELSRMGVKSSPMIGEYSHPSYPTDMLADGKPMCTQTGTGLGE